MNILSQLIENLEKSERIHFKKYLQLYSEKESKYLKMFEIVESDLEISDEDLILRLYGKPSKSFYMLRSRLIEKILDFLSMDLQLEVNDERLNTSFKKILLRKRLIKCELLWERGLRGVLENMLLDLLEASLDIYAHDVALEVCLLLRRMNFEYVCRGKPINDWVKELLRAYEAEIMAGEIFSYTSQYGEKLSQIEEVKTHIENLLPSLESLIKQVESPRAKWIYHYTMSERRRLQQDYTGALNDINECIQISHTKQGLVSSLQTGNFYFRKGYIYYQNLYLEEAKACFQEAIKLYPSKRLNSYQAEKYVGIIEVLQGNVGKGIEILRSLVTPKTQELLPYHTNLCQAYLSLSYFCMKDIKQAWKVLPNLEFFLEDKGGLHTIVRVMELLLIIEKEDFQMYELKLDSFRKYVKKYHAESKYYEQVYHFFNRLNYLSFDYAKMLKEKSYEYLQTVKWNPVDYEVIHLGCWLRSKLEGKKYLEVWKEYFKELREQMPELSS